MFNSTHTLVGLAIARTGVDKWVPYATATAVLASNLPDIDSVAGFWGTAAYLDHHRGITHSLIGVPVLAFLLSAVMYFFSGNFARTYAVAVIAMATHPLLDLLNPYGLRPFLPWSNKWYYGDVVFIFDPYLDTVLLIGLLGAWRLARRKKLIVALSLVLAFTYVAVRIELHSQAASTLQKMSLNSNPSESTAVLPTIDPRVWEVFAFSDDHISKSFVCLARCDEADDQVLYLEKTGPAAVIGRASRSPSAAAMMRFARFPVSSVVQTPSGFTVTFLDLRFLRAAPDVRQAPDTALASIVTLDRNLRPVSETLSFVQTVTLPGLVRKIP